MAGISKPWTTCYSKQYFHSISSQGSTHTTGNNERATPTYAIRRPNASTAPKGSPRAKRRVIRLARWRCITLMHFNKTPVKSTVHIKPLKRIMIINPSPSHDTRLRDDRSTRRKKANKSIQAKKIDEQKLYQKSVTGTARLKRRNPKHHKRGKRKLLIQQPRRRFLYARMH